MIRGRPWMMPIVKKSPNNDRSFTVDRKKGGLKNYQILLSFLLPSGWRNATFHFYFNFFPVLHRCHVISFKSIDRFIISFGNNIFVHKYVHHGNDYQIFKPFQSFLSWQDTSKHVQKCTFLFVFWLFGIASTWSIYGLTCI